MSLKALVCYNYILIYFLLISYTALCFCDELERGIDPQLWKKDPINSWTIDTDDYCVGIQSIKSEVRFNQNSSISTIRIGGPRTIYWYWKTENGENQRANNIMFLDNGNPTGYSIIDENSWVPASYNITDAAEHELTWLAFTRTNGGVGIARIDGICITEPLVVFLNNTTTPLEGISVSPSANGINATMFNYSVEIETELLPINVKLITISPSNSVNYYVSNNLTRLSEKKLLYQWNNIKCNSINCGLGKYWFECEYANEYPIKSQIFLGPHITNFIKDTQQVRYNSTENGFSEIYCINITGQSDRTISLKGLDRDEGDWRTIKDTKNYTAGDGFKPICWDVFWPIEKQIPDSIKFIVI